MSKFIEFEFCELPDTPYRFDKTKFKAGDPDQIKLYKDSKAPRRKKRLTYTEITDEDKLPNYARVVPKGCMFIDFDNSDEAKEASLRTPGNAINLYEGIVENQVGKKGISICATGLKSFFGLT